MNVYFYFLFLAHTRVSVRYLTCNIFFKLSIFLLSGNLFIFQFSETPSIIEIMIFLLHNILQVTVGRYCTWSNQTVQKVESCPVTKEELIKRREVKKCHLLSQKQNCTKPFNFKYHCVMNEFEDAFVEVCAPAYMINGQLYAYYFTQCVLSFLTHTKNIKTNFKPL